MIGGIVTVPSRLEMADALKLVMEGFCREVHVFVDEELKGVTWNSLRMISEIQSLAEPGEAMFFSTDDAIVCENFEEKFDTLHALAGMDVYSLAMNTPDIANLPKGAGPFIPITTKRFSFSDIGWVVINTERMQGLADQLAAYEAGLKRYDLIRYRSAKHFDLLVSLFLPDSKIPFAVAFPCLTKHDLSVESTLGHTPTNAAFFFSDDISHALARVARILENAPKIEVPEE